MTAARASGLLVALLAALMAWAGAAGAHVSVLPGQVTQGEAQQFTIRVPNERDVPTTAVSVAFPDEITVYAFADPPGDWTVAPVRAPDGRFTGAEYRGGQVAVDGYVDFTVLGTPFDAGQALFPARQTYADGQVKPWTGPPDVPGQVSPETGPTDPGPAAAVQVVEAGATGATTPAVPVAEAASGDDGSDAGVWLGIIAIAIAVLAVLGVGLLWSTRPARLPPGD